MSAECSCHRRGTDCEFTQENFLPVEGDQGENFCLASQEDIFFIAFREREREKKREREDRKEKDIFAREKHPSVASLMCLDQDCICADQGSQVPVPGPGIEPVT